MSAIVKQYKEYVGDIDELLNRFTALSKKFIKNKKWHQVLTSRTTGIMGTGISFSSVNAEYALDKNGYISLTNRAYNGDFKPIFIKGVCEYRNKDVPTCRFVKFDNISIKGDYWIIYISKDKTTFVVSAPLIVFGKVLLPNFGLYVLTENRDEYWKNSKKQEEISNVLNEYGFNKNYNKPVFSGESRVGFLDGKESKSRIQF